MYIKIILVLFKKCYYFCHRINKGFAMAILHSGDIGDIIYSLPAIRELGIKDFILNCYNRLGTQMTEAKARFIFSFLEWYGFDVRLGYFRDLIPYGVFDGDRFRIDGSVLSTIHLGEAIAMSYLGISQGYASYLLSRRWLDFDEDLGDYIVIFRSPRYHNIYIDYSLLLNDLVPSGYKLYFLGLEWEYRSFLDMFPLLDCHIEYYKVKDFLEAGKVIAGSRLVIGNQTGLFSLAEGMKKRRILEESTFVRNCHLSNPDLDIYYFFEAEDYEYCRKFIKESL